MNALCFPHKKVEFAEYVRYTEKGIYVTGNHARREQCLYTPQSPPLTKPQGQECTSIDRPFRVSKLRPRAGNQVQCPT